MPEQIQLFFVQRFKGKVLFNVPMSEYTSLGVGGAAEVMAFPQDEADLKDVLGFAKTKRYPVFILGCGTNLLVRDKGIRGVVINMTEGFKDIEWDADKMSVVAGAGVVLSKMVRLCTDRGLSGLEFAEGIPGSLGGAVAMNAGAFGGEMKDVTDGVELLGYAKTKRSWTKGFVSRSELAFSYRSIVLPEESVITGVHMRFSKSSSSEVELRVKEVRRKRKESAPIKSQSAGSIFKNPDGGFAGKLIEEAGLKGKSIGGAQISEAHANYIINKGSAKAKDVLALMALARDEVYRLKGIVLEPEIKVVGED